jgi:hypothetical protein
MSTKPCTGNCYYLVKKNPKTKELEWVLDHDNCHGDCDPCPKSLEILGRPKKGDEGARAIRPCPPKPGAASKAAPKPFRLILPKGTPVIIDTY